jgi:type II secretory pathway pseudopilin PulG
MYETPQAPLTPTEPAPGAKAAAICGILSIPSGFLCFPIGIVLGIVALVQHGKAKRAAAAEPGRYADVPGTGMVTGIIGLILGPILAIVGILAAIAIPALLGQREKARARIVQMRVATVAAETARVADDLHLREGHAPSPEQVVAEVLASPGMSGASATNPYHPGAPVYRRGSTATEDGEVVLDPEPAYRDPDTGQTYAAVVIHGRYVAAGQPRTFDKVVALD